MIAKCYWRIVRFKKKHTRIVRRPVQILAILPVAVRDISLILTRWTSRLYFETGDSGARKKLLSVLHLLSFYPPAAYVPNTVLKHTDVTACEPREILEGKIHGSQPVGLPKYRLVDQRCQTTAEWKRLPFDRKTWERK